jgi:hypothetical protein
VKDTIKISSKITKEEGIKKNINKDHLIIILMITKAPIIRFLIIRHKYQTLILLVQDKT